MKTVWIASLAIAASTSAFAQTTIYKHVDESGRVTYSNKPMKDAVVVELEPLTTIPSTPAGILGVKPAPAAESAPKAHPAVATVTPVTANALMPVSQKTTLASVEPTVQRRRDDERRRILEEELAREEQSLDGVRDSLLKEQQNPDLVSAVRAAQQATDPTPTQLAQFRLSIDKASGRIRGLQATAAEHEKNIEALKKELGALKP